MPASPGLRSAFAPAAVVLAAGAGSRFSHRPGEKLLVPIEGTPMLAHVLATLREYGPAATIVVLGHGADAVEAAIDWAGEVRVRNPAPDRGIASSLAVGIDALRQSPVAVDATFVVLGDQPRLSVATLRALEQAASDPATPDRPLIAPVYVGDPGPLNPVLVGRTGWPLVRSLGGHRGLGPFIAEHPELCLRVPVRGRMPDVDTPEDVEGLTARSP